MMAQFHRMRRAIRWMVTVARVAIIVGLLVTPQAANGWATPFPTTFSTSSSTRPHPNDDWVGLFLVVARRGTRALDYRHNKNNKVVVSSHCLFGVLDDMMDENSASSSLSSLSSSSTSSSVVVAEHEELLNDLIFSTGDTRHDIQERFHECTHPPFWQWLRDLRDASTDAQEQDALSELLQLIDTVYQQQQQQQQQRQQQQDEEMVAQEPSQPPHETNTMSDTTRQSSTPSTKKMSAAEILKQAQQIDQAVITAAAASDDNDDEQPSNFMRDAKAERGLSGFNSKGQMRVGGS